jgi:hypothetical protein
MADNSNLMDLFVDVNSFIAGRHVAPKEERGLRPKDIDILYRITEFMPPDITQALFDLHYEYNGKGLLCQVAAKVGEDRIKAGNLRGTKGWPMEPYEGHFPPEPEENIRAFRKAIPDGIIRGIHMEVYADAERVLVELGEITGDLFTGKRQY